MPETSAEYEKGLIAFIANYNRVRKIKEPNQDDQDTLAKYAKLFRNLEIINETQPDLPEDMCLVPECERLYICYLQKKLIEFFRTPRFCYEIIIIAQLSAICDSASAYMGKYKDILQPYTDRMKDEFKLPFNGLFLEPIQRTCRYLMLVSDLQNTLGDSLGQYVQNNTEHLVKLCKKAAQVINYCDGKIFQSDQLALQVSKGIVPLQRPLATPAKGMRGLVSGYYSD
jgi:hypothetical protein